MDDPGTGGTWDEMFESWVRSKQEGPLVCPVCARRGSFTPGGTVGAVLVDDVARPTAQFGYAYCENCGYTMFFNADVSKLRYG